MLPKNPISKKRSVSAERVKSHLLQARLRISQDVEDLGLELKQIATSRAESITDDEHDSEGSTVGFELARVAALLNHAQQRLTDLDAAERRCIEGTYGLCARCGDSIGTERLEALPVTRICMRCANID